MKKFFKNISLLGLGALAMSMVACNDFEEINIDPTAVGEELILPSYLLANSIFLAQQDPHIAERAFILYWDAASRFGSPASFNLLSATDSWSDDYMSISYLGGWINYAVQTVSIAEDQIEEGINTPGTNNILQIARIWRAYLYSEFADNFGPAPLNGYQGENPLYDSEEDVYNFILTELKEAVAAIEVDAEMSEAEMSADIFYFGDMNSWIKYANSLRMRYAMRLSLVDPSTAKSEFESAASSLSNVISSASDIATVAESGSWNPTTGVMTRTWNGQYMTLTMANLSSGLGGVSLYDMNDLSVTAANGLTDDVIAANSKDPNSYVGLYLPTQLSENTNVYNAGYMMDYLPLYADPRVFINYNIPGHDDGSIASTNFAKSPSLATTADLRMSTDDDAKTITVRAGYTFAGRTMGEGLTKSTLWSDFTNSNCNTPNKSQLYRNNENSRVFFGAWETYFLIAEAALYGWSVPMGVQEAYEAGIAASFEFHGITSLYDTYINSERRNRIGTSVKYSHTEEASTISLTYADGSSTSYNMSSPVESTKTFTYPTGIYAKNNDALAKIITQKYLAQCPWLPGEAWSDYRRLGLPFMENPIREAAISTMPNYSDYSVASQYNMPQRLQYPASFPISNPDGYTSAASYLEGSDVVSTPLWWAMEAN